jgi:hypothetical protein
VGRWSGLVTTRRALTLVARRNRSASLSQSSDHLHEDDGRGHHAEDGGGGGPGGVMRYELVVHLRKPPPSLARSTARIAVEVNFTEYFWIWRNTNAYVNEIFSQEFFIKNFKNSSKFHKISIFLNK